MSGHRLSGVIAALPTPVTVDDRPDIPRFVTLARRLLDDGCDALNVCGTTGEATSLSVAQRALVMSAAVAALPPARLMVGTGAAAVSDAVSLTRLAAELGFAGALLLPPFYYKGVPNAGVVAYVEAVARATEDCPIPLYLYHFPALSGVPYTPELVAELRRRLPSRIVGLKDSSGDLDYARTVAGIANDFAVFPSNEATLQEARSGTFAGCISATATVNSAFCAKAWRAGDAAAQATATAIRVLVSAGPLIPRIKSVVADMMADPAYAAVLPPMAALPAEEAATLATAVRRLAATT
ncbi:MAG: dihydrodipicolinate synthase family protein [Rhodospirillales bacterium]|jgi:4-hydroxy-tetrahydrodipicolinate synthase